MPPIRTEKLRSDKAQQSSSHPSSHPYTSHTPEHIPPKNAFLLFVSHFCERHRQLDPIERDPSRRISQMAGFIWNMLPDEAKAYWYDLAKTEKEEHARMFPDYKYQSFSRSKVRLRKQRRISTDIDWCHQLAERKEVQSLEESGTSGSRESTPRPIACSSSSAKVKPEPTPSPIVVPFSSSLLSVQVVKSESPRISFEPSPTNDYDSIRPNPGLDQPAVAEEQSFPVDSIVAETHESEYTDVINVEDIGEVVFPEFIPTEDIPPLDLLQ